VSLNATLYRLANPFIDPPTFDFWASKISPTLSWNRCLAKVVERRAEAKGSVTLVLKPNRHFKGFQPGQHLNVTVDVNGIRHTRSYSFTGIPRNDRLISITIKHIDGGKVSTTLCRQIQVGDVLELSPAFGDMTLPKSPTSPVLLLAAGSGITPLMSLIRALTQQPLNQTVTLLYWARTRAELCFLQELEALAKRDTRFIPCFVLTREPKLLPGELTGRPSEAMFAEIINDLDAQQVYACGPGGFVNNVKELLEGRVKSFQAEAFTLPATDVGDVGVVQVHLKASGRTLTLPAGESLLTALEAQGVVPRSGCRMGICNTCSCIKTGGTTENMITGVLESEPTGALKICINRPRTDLTLEL